MSAPFRAFIAAQPPAQATWRARHARVAVPVRAAAPQKQTSLLDADQTAKALEIQRQRAQQRAPASQEQPAAAAQALRGLEADLAARKKAARAWVTPWLDAARQTQAQRILAELRGRVALLSREQEAAALQRLLGPNALAMAGEAGAAGAAPLQQEPSAEEAPSGSSDGGSGGELPGGAVEDHPSRYAPSEVLEDGAVIYSMELLQALSYEDVLAP